MILHYTFLGWQGPYCTEAMTDPCDRCGHGWCDSSDNGTYTCTCFGGWHGDHCIIPPGGTTTESVELNDTSITGICIGSITENLTGVIAACFIDFIIC